LCRAILGRAPEQIAPNTLDEQAAQEFVRRIAARGRVAGRLDQWTTGSRYLIGYNMTSLPRNVLQAQGYLFSIPSIAFVRFQEFCQYILNLLVYSAEIVVPLEASDPASYGRSERAPIDTDATRGLLSLAAELQPLLDTNVLHMPVCHFFHDGIRSLSE